MVKLIRDAVYVHEPRTMGTAHVLCFNISGATGAGDDIQTAGLICGCGAEIVKNIFHMGQNAAAAHHRKMVERQKVQ